MGALDLAGTLADRGIRGLRSLQPGHSEQVVCPRCQGGRTREKSLTVTIDDDGQGAVWVCHRGKCAGYQDGARVVANLDTYRRHKREEEPRKPPPEPENPDKPEWMYRFFHERKIGARIVNKLGIYAQTRNFPNPVGRSECIVFPYVWDGEVRNHKYRPHPAKSPQQQDRGALPTLYNADAVKAAEGGTLYWVEGEPDVAAMLECGYGNAVSLKDGAPKQANFREDDERFAAMKTHAAALEKVQRHVIATDMDEAGRALAEEIARRVGRHKACLVEWPEGRKDACDALREDGLEELQRCIEEAYPYPIDGIFPLNEDEVMAFIDAPPIPTLTTGTMATDGILKFPAEGRLIVLTGYANQGKTTFMRFLMVHHIRKYRRKWLVFSPEHMPPAAFYREVAECWIGKPIRKSASDGLPSATHEEVADALVHIKPAVKVLAADSVDTEPTLDWLLERATAMVLRDGITDFAIDPWNEVEHARGNMNETEYIGRCLQRLRSWSARHGCNVWVNPHPSKPPPLRNGEKRKPPDGYDISGSAHWMNKPDLGITVWADTPGTTEILVWKAKHYRWGRRGTSAQLEYNEYTRQYTSPVAASEPQAPVEEIPEWAR